jgi:hypothetical protein
VTAPSNVRPAQAGRWTPYRLIAAAAVLTVLVVGVVLAFSTPANVLPWIAAGFIAAGVALAMLIGFL